jgi:preprotein translocase subunit SecF
MRPIKLVPDSTNIPFLSFRWWAMGSSILLLIASLALVAINGLNWGVDFSGGQTVRISFAKPTDVAEIRSRISAMGVEDAAIQQFGSPNDISIRVPLPNAKNPLSQCFGSNPLAQGGGSADDSNKMASEIRAGILEQYPDAKFGSVETVSGKVSCELFSTGGIALTLAMLGIALFIWFRFEWQFGVGALFTLFHDVVLTFGFFALTQLEFNLNVVAAILTIIGYSLNDTIVVYDRIRENLRKWRKMEISALLDLSVNETLSRTIVTSLSLILTLAVLLVLGPEVIFGFTASMLLGIVIGTFSSIYVSAPILIWLKVRSDSFVPLAAAGVNERNAKPEGFVK